MKATLHFTLFFFISFFLPTDLLAYVPPTNDACVDAIEIADLSGCNSIHVDGTDATSENNTNVCSPSAEDVWYKFTATTERLILKTIDLSSYNSAIQFGFYKGGCGALIRAGDGFCWGIGGDGNSAVIKGFSIGEQYFLRIWFNRGQEADICIEEACDFEVLSHVISSCDNGDNTYNLSVEISATNLVVGDSLSMQLAGGLGNSDNGVRVTSTSTTFTFIKNNLPATGGEIVFNIRESNRRCYEFFANFDAPMPCVTSPINDDCINATEIDDLANCQIIKASTFGATPSSNLLYPCHSTAADIWFKFTANTTSIDIRTVELSDYGTHAMYFEIYEGDCNNLNRMNYCRSLGCENCNSNRVIDGLVLGHQYYLRVWFFLEGVEADICLQAVDGNICNEHSLLLDMPTTNQATYQTEQTITAQGIIPNTDITTFIAEQSITLMPGFHVQPGAEFHAYIEDCTPPSPLVETPAEVRTTAKGTQTTPTPLVEDLAVAPNPFRYSTNLKYTLEMPTAVSLHIYSLSGQLVQELVTQETQSEGIYEYTFEPKEDAGNFYFAVMTTPEQVITKKLIFIR